MLDKLNCIFRAIVLALLAASAIPAMADSDSGINYDVAWNSLGKNCNDSMPIGNGDIGMNLWTEQNGAIVFLIGKTDAFSENGQLLKLGRVRVKLTPNPFVGSNFSQVLKVREGEIDLQGGSSADHPDLVRIWVDANHPVIHIEATTNDPVDVEADVELWRNQARITPQGGEELGGTGALRELNNSPDPITIDPDTVLPAQNDRLTWCHFNTRTTYPIVLKNQHLDSLLDKYPDPLLHRAFGVVMKGAGMASSDDRTLKTKSSSSNNRLDLYAMTEQTDSPQTWQADLNKIVDQVDAVDIEAARKAHQKWWADFWNRSWINVTGTPEADEVTQSYAMQRWMEACGGRGALPMKYNGSIFTVGQEPPPGTDTSAKGQRDPDYRSWGGNFWFQNQRHLYWPLMASGDEDILAPFIKMYLDDLPLEKDRVKVHFNHSGASYPETMYFWGTQNNNDFGWGNSDNVGKNTWVRYHIEGSLELIAMMLDRYDYTQDSDFAKTSLVPIAEAVTTFYDQHWKRGPDGKIRMNPATSIETYQNSINPTPDLAGLMNILPRLLGLPQDLTTGDQRDLWQKMLADLPPLPKGTTDDKGKMPPYGKDAPDGLPILLPAEKYDGAGNVENPELYPVFPFRLYGVGKPDLDIAKNTYGAKRFKSSTCWGQDGEEAALLGLTDVAQHEVIANCTDYGDQRFKWFWKPGNDWIPDMDNGGAGMETLQLMLIQCDGKRIQLLPAWPSNWNADFKLYAPYQTTIQAKVSNGKITDLQVTPPERQKDVVIVTPGANPDAAP
jgi:alpha-L-fucosidase 2